MISIVLFTACVLILTETNSAKSSDVKYIGCFRDKGNPSRAFAGHYGEASGFDACYKLAASKGIEYFGLQHGGECWMNENKNQKNEYSKYGQVGDEECGPAGGSWKNKVYRMLYPVNGGWSDWSHWGHCSKPCDGGIQFRSRSCTNPRPAHGGRGCVGLSTESRPCNTQECCRDAGGWLHCHVPFFDCLADIVFNKCRKTCHKC